MINRYTDIVFDMETDYLDCFVDYWTKNKSKDEMAYIQLITENNNSKRKFDKQFKDKLAIDIEHLPEELIMQPELVAQMVYIYGACRHENKELDDAKMHLQTALHVDMKDNPDEYGIVGRNTKSKRWQMINLNKKFLRLKSAVNYSRKKEVWAKGMLVSVIQKGRALENLVNLYEKGLFILDNKKPMSTKKIKKKIEEIRKINTINIKPEGVDVKLDKGKDGYDAHERKLDDEKMKVESKSEKEEEK